MELKKTVTFETPEIYVNCYGDKDAVVELETFWDAHAEMELEALVSDVGIEMLAGRIEGSATMAHHPVPKPVQPKSLHDLGFCVSRNREKCQIFLFQRAVSAIFFAEGALSAGVSSRPDGGTLPF